MGIRQDLWTKIYDTINDFENIQDIIIYGSRAKGNFRKFSDIDLTLVGEGLVHTDLFTILDRLEDLNLPFEIDLSLLSEIDNPQLVAEIQEHGISLKDILY